MDTGHTLISTFDQALLAVMILVIMFGMGASLTPSDFRETLKRPRAVLAGFGSQFGLMPLFAVGLAVLLDLDPPRAIALILVGCLPGGTTSNMFAYFARGSVALSISLTAASTVLALVMMPLLLELHASGFARQISQSGDAGEFVIPHRNIVVSLLLVLVPVAAGMVLRRLSRSWAKTAEDTAGFTGMIVIIFLLSSAIIRSGQLFLETPWTTYAACIGIGIAGFCFGWGLSWCLRLPPRHRRTVSLETGIQNGPIAFAIILLSFSGSVRDEMLWLAILYSAFIVATASGVTLAYRRFGKYDWEVHRNQTIHARLFGSDFISAQPPEPSQ